MPTKSEAAEAAGDETSVWAEFVHEWSAERHPALWSDLPPTEAAVVRFYSPCEDLDHRARYWGYAFEDYGLADLARFGAALARTEAEAWDNDEPHVATRAYADRRFLLGDRLLHWAAPWLDEVARCHANERDVAGAAFSALLELGERLRPAPILTEGHEGLTAPGEDSYGPIGVPTPIEELLLSVWSGRVVLAATLEPEWGWERGERLITAKWLSESTNRNVLAGAFEEAAARWSALAGACPGSAQLWRDLGARAERTAAMLQDS